MLQAYDRALLGGTPRDVPDLMRERNPIEHVDAVAEPVLILAGRNDSRCPIRQVMNYVDRLELALPRGQGSGADLKIGACVSTVRGSV